MKISNDQQYEILRTLMADTTQMAKYNLKTFGYLEKVLIVLTERGPVIINLKWANNIEKRYVLGNCVNQMAQKRCQVYIFVGEANTKILQFNKNNSTKDEIQDSILILGETRDRQKIVSITPIIREQSNKSIKFGNTIWFDKQESFQSFDFNLFDGIFNY